MSGAGFKSLSKKLWIVKYSLIQQNTGIKIVKKNNVSKAVHIGHLDISILELQISHIVKNNRHSSYNRICFTNFLKIYLLHVSQVLKQ